MKDVIYPQARLSALALALIIPAALILTQFVALASNQSVGGGGVSPAAQIAPAHPVLNVTANRTGPHGVRLSWAFGSTNPPRFYLFHVASATAPQADWESGGWANDLIVAGTARQADLNVAAATKPQHNYYLICIAGKGSAYTCSSVFAESVSLTAPMMLQH